MTNELRFERVVCGRCSGTGKYSYCQTYGSTCFQCQGHGEVPTKRGAAANAWLIEQRKIPVSQVTVGMRIRTHSTTMTVREITTDSQQRLILVGQKIQLGVFADDVVEKMPLNETERMEQLKAAIEYQGQLTKAGKPRKRGGVMRLTLSLINRKLEELGHAERLVRGTGYFYFIGGAAASWYSSSILVSHLNQLTLEQWIAERDHLAGAGEAPDR